jgi:hypothetical protein
MGNQQSSSETVSDIVNKSVSNVLVSSSSTCAQNNSLENLQVFNNITADEGCSISISNVSQTANQSPNFTCSSSSANSTDLQSKFQAELKQQTDAAIKNTTLGNANAQSKNTSKTVNDISTNIDINTVSSCVQNNFLKQTQGVNNLKASCPSYCRNPDVCAKLPAGSTFCDSSKCSIALTDFTQSSIQNAVGKCLADNTTYQKVLSETATKVSQEAAAKNAGVSVAEIVTAGGGAISGIISSSQTIFIVIGVVIVIIVAIAIYFSMGSGIPSFQPQSVLPQSVQNMIPQSSSSSLNNTANQFLNTAKSSPIGQQLLNNPELLDKVSNMFNMNK